MSSSISRQIKRALARGKKPGQFKISYLPHGGNNPKKYENINGTREYTPSADYIALLLSQENERER